VAESLLVRGARLADASGGLANDLAEDVRLREALRPDPQLEFGSRRRRADRQRDRAREAPGYVVQADFSCTPLAQCTPTAQRGLENGAKPRRERSPRVKVRSAATRNRRRGNRSHPARRARSRLRRRGTRERSGTAQSTQPR